jgi:hypothetical protein
MTTPEKTEEQKQTEQSEQPIQPHHPGFWDHHNSKKPT